MGGAPPIESEKIAGIQVSTSGYGKPIPIVFGQTRIPGNLIFHANLERHKTTDQAAAKGGAPENSTYTYTAAVMLALCEGPISGVGKVWRDKKRGSMSSFGFSLIAGNRAQAPWVWLVHHRPEKALGYAGTALAVNAELDLGTSASVGNYTFEVKGFHRIPEGQYGSPDANPADIVRTLLTDQFFGAAWDSAHVGDLESYRVYCQAAGFWISPALLDQKSLADHIKDILDSTNSDIILSGDVLKIVPYGDLPIDDNGAIYTPNSTPIYDLSEDDFMTSRNENGDPDPDADPLKVERISEADTYNVIPIQFRDREIDYNDSTYDDPDNADVEESGGVIRKGSVVQLAGITRKEHATQMSRILTQRSLYCRNKYEFALSPRFVLLEPMDLVTLTDEKFGLDHKVVRITEINEGEDGELEIKAEDWPFGVATASLFGSQGNAADDLDTNVEPGPVNEPDIFDSPALLSDEGKAQVLIAASGGELWGGAEVWVSDTGDSYQRIGRIEQPARHGALTATLAAWYPSRDPDADDARLDDIHSFSVQLVEGSGELRSVTDAQRDALVSLCYVGGELLAYKSATLTGVRTYSLASLQRGVYGTGSGPHEIAERFVRLDEAVFRYDIPQSWVGQTIYVKLRSFNIYGAGLEALEDCVAYPFTPSVIATGVPAPENVRLSISATKPAAASRRHRASQNEGSDTIVVRAGGSKKVKKGKWAIVKWDFASPRPAHMDQGFRIVFYHDGGDPNHEEDYATEPVIAKKRHRELVMKLAPDEDTLTLNAAVQALYLNERESDWATSEGSIIIDTDDEGGIDPPTAPEGKNLVYGADGDDADKWHINAHAPTDPNDAPGPTTDDLVIATASVDVWEDPRYGSFGSESYEFIGPYHQVLYRNTFGFWTWNKHSSIPSAPVVQPTLYPTIHRQFPHKNPEAGHRFYRKGGWVTCGMSVAVGSHPFIEGTPDTATLLDEEFKLRLIFFTNDEIGDDSEDNFTTLMEIDNTKLQDMFQRFLDSDRLSPLFWVRWARQFKFPDGVPTNPNADAHNRIALRWYWKAGVVPDLVGNIEVYVDKILVMKGQRPLDSIWGPDAVDEAESYVGDFTDNYEQVNSDEGDDYAPAYGGNGADGAGDSGDVTEVPD